MEINKILWASDGSRESDEALKYVELLAEHYGSHTLGLSVIKPLNLDYITRLPHEIKQELFEIELEHEKREYKRIQDALHKINLDQKFDIRTESGRPDDVILKVADQEQVDLIVMGKRGLGLIDRIAIGSTTLSVLRKSEIPVLSVKKRERESETTINNILVPFDISEDLDSALLYAVELADRENAAITVAYVFWTDSHIYDMPPGLVDDLIARSGIELKKRVEDVKPKKGAVEIDLEVLHGYSSALIIADYAEAKKIDLIVINTHARKGIKRFFLGSVTEKVIQEANCPVLALRP